MRRFIELNHTIFNGMISYPGMPPVKIDALYTREMCSAEFHDDPGGAALLDRIQMVNISGTYLDSPYHLWDSGYKVCDIPLEKCFDLPAFVVHRAAGRRRFHVSDLAAQLADCDLTGAAVLLNSGHDRLFMTPAYEQDVPCLTVEGARWLIERGVVFVGIDTQLIDDFMHKELGNICHEVILGVGAIVCEDMTGLDQLPDRGARLYAIAPRVEAASFPGRVFAVVDE